MAPRNSGGIPCIALRVLYNMPSHHASCTQDGRFCRKPAVHVCHPSHSSATMLPCRGCSACGHPADA